MAHLHRAAAQAGEPPSLLLDALARAPAAAALVVRALERAEDRKALRLACTQLRDAVDEATTRLEVDLYTTFARPPTPARWPRLEELTIYAPVSAALVVLGAESWGRLRTLRLGHRDDVTYENHLVLDVPSARALAAALRRMPALRALELKYVELLEDAAGALFRASSAEGASQPRLEELDLTHGNLDGAAAAALVAAPAFSLRRLYLSACGLDAAALLAVAHAPWPLEELNLFDNDFDAAALAPALAALSRHAGLRKLDVSVCNLGAAGFKALVEATWPALTHFNAGCAYAVFTGPLALGAAAFAGFPAIEE